MVLRENRQTPNVNHQRAKRFSYYQRWKKENFNEKQKENLKGIVGTQKSFRIFTAVFCVIFIVYIINVDETKISSFTSISNPWNTTTGLVASFNSCQPKKNIIFLKTHKCASSSIQNIFSRFGYRHNLLFVLPAKGSYIGHPAPFNWSMVPDAGKYGLQYNILTHHCRLNYNEMRQGFPNDTVFITIVRNPVELYESLFSFYSLHRFYKERFDTLGKHQRPPEYYQRRYGGKIGFNQMLFDLGFNEKSFMNFTAVREYVRFLDSVFDLVLVREKMDESLVLLQSLLCWDVDDVIVFKLNARNKKYRRKMSAELLSRLTKFNSADMILYRYFVRQLNKKIKDFGEERMSLAVEELRNRTRDWYNVCVQKQDFQSRVINSRRYYTNRMVMAYVKKKFVNTTCDDLTTQEAIFTEKLRFRQRFMFPKPKPYRSRPYKYKYRMYKWNNQEVH